MPKCSKCQKNVSDVRSLDLFENQWRHAKKLGDVCAICQDDILLCEAHTTLES